MTIERIDRIPSSVELPKPEKIPRFSHRLYIKNYQNTVPKAPKATTQWQHEEKENVGSLARALFQGENR